MTAETTLIEAAVARAEAWQGLRNELGGLREDLVARPIGQRVRDRLVDEMVDIVDGAGGMVRETAPALGATLGLLAAWSLRGPLADGVQWLWDHRPDALRRRKSGGFWK